MRRWRILLGERESSAPAEVRHTSALRAGVHFWFATERRCAALLLWNATLNMAFADKLRTNVSEHVSLFETILYLCVGVLLCALAGIYQAGAALWHGFSAGNNGILALDQLLLVLMLIEILHTVRISIRTQTLTVVPFLIVGLIAPIRRILVIAMQAARMAEPGSAPSDQFIVFRNSMIEMGLLGFLILVFFFRFTARAAGCLAKIC